uniref:Uncharacterized protein n=1 Tax=Clastoptera arizonana TaxID=38151 RepID=A0A1B6EDK8_9HEMI
MTLRRRRRDKLVGGSQFSVWLSIVRTYADTVKMKFVGIFFIINVGFTVSAPNHLKTVVFDNNEVPAVAVGGTGVSASWGGYSAKAGLGGNTGVGGGLYASANSPHGNAAAGLNGEVGDNGPAGALGSSAQAGSSSGGVANSAADTSSSATHATSAATAGTHTQVTYRPGGLFDNIFNIPISVLQAVNTHLNQQGGVTKTVRLHGRRRHRPSIDNRSTFAESSGSTVADSTSIVHNDSTQPQGHNVGGADNGGTVGGTVTIQKRPVNYDNIFNIPISALQAVNKLLNDGFASISKNVNVQVSHNNAGHAHSQTHVQQEPGNIGSSVSAGASVHIVKEVQNVPQTYVQTPGNIGSSVSAEKEIQNLPQSAAYTAHKPAATFDNVFNASYNLYKLNRL